MEIAELVQYITWLAKEREESLSPLRLVKFLYLADLYHARRNRGKTLTGWRWRFVHYGPFCTESLHSIEHAVQSGLIVAVPFESKFDDEPHFLYRTEQEKEPAIERALPFYVVGPLKGAVMKWAGDTYGLLDHVYFETEPMQNVNPGDVLDFSKAKEPEPFAPVKMRKLSRTQVSEGKALIAKMREGQKACMISEPEQIYDEIYSEALAFLDGENLDLKIEGKARIEDQVKEIE
ncbi:MAG: hypothetical protein C4576_29765 [Desulfobacteraceae bacterium]|nr:MAG: hypothetical protein C4576_29765 [Desulfobacteraceae bacterium]